MEFKLLLSIMILFNVLNGIKSFSEWWENSKVVDLTYANFFNYVSGDKYVVVKFFTKWCYYCRKLSPIYEEVFDYYKGKRDDIIIARVECGQNDYIALTYNITSYPMVGLFFPKNATMQSTFQRGRTLNNIVSWIDKLAPKSLKNDNKNIKISEQKQETVRRPSNRLKSNAMIPFPINNPVKESESVIKLPVSAHDMSKALAYIKSEAMDLRKRTIEMTREIQNIHKTEPIIIKDITPRITKETLKPKPQQIPIIINPNTSINYPFLVGIFLLLSITAGAIITTNRLIFSNK